MTKPCYVFLALSLVPGQVFGAEYSAGWTFENFYQEIVTCKAAIVMPAAASYEERARANKQPEEPLRSEVISMSRIFDQTAAAGCFCAINEIAKATPYQEYERLGNQSARLTSVKKMLDGPMCSSRLEAVMTLLKKPESRDALVLK